MLHGGPGRQYPLIRGVTNVLKEGEQEVQVMIELRSETKRRQDEIRAVAKSAKKHATEKTIKHLRDKHCASDDERDIFDRELNKQ